MKLFKKLIVMVVVLCVIPIIAFVSGFNLFEKEKRDCSINQSGVSSITPPEMRKLGVLQAEELNKELSKFRKTELFLRSCDNSSSPTFVWEDAKSEKEGKLDVGIHGYDMAQVHIVDDIWENYQGDPEFTDLSAYFSNSNFTSHGTSISLSFNTSDPVKMKTLVKDAQQILKNSENKFYGVMDTKISFIFNGNYITKINSESKTDKSIELLTSVENYINHQKKFYPSIHDYTIEINPMECEVLLFFANDPEGLSKFKENESVMLQERMRFYRAIYDEFHVEARDAGHPMIEPYGQ